jgi:aquaporin Z
MGAVWVEALATIVYSLVATGVVASTNMVTVGELLPPRLVVIALSNGLSYTTAVYITSRATRQGLGYLNPAVTIAMMCANPATKRYQWYNSGLPGVMRGMFLMFAQFVGALLGVLLVLGVVPRSGDTPEALGVPRIGNGATPANACAFEAMGTFFLTFVVLCCECRSPGNSRSASAPLAVGLAMTVLVLFTFPFTGAIFNPFRAFWLFVCGMNFSWDWVPFLFGPVLGALGAVLVYTLAFTSHDVLNRSDKSR